MVGDPAFNLEAQKLIFGESPLITDDKVHYQNKIYL